MASDTLVASLDVIIQLLADANWREKAKEVRTLKELRWLLLDFCKAENGGKTIRIDKNTIYLYQ